MLAALTLRDAGDPRHVVLYDTFSGMAEPSTKDGPEVHRQWREQQKDGRSDWCYASLADVKRNMQRVALKDIAYVEGKVEDTLPGTLPGGIALLRLDTDWYESTKAELVHLYPLLQHGGVLIVDDYGQWVGSRTAVDEYFADQSGAPLMNRIDGGCYVGVKP